MSGRVSAPKRRRKRQAKSNDKAALAHRVILRLMGYRVNIIAINYQQFFSLKYRYSIVWQSAPHKLL